MTIATEQSSASFNSNSPRNNPTGYADLDFQINLEFFTGPMDLLLHLVSQREVPIEKVSLKEVLDQYLEIVLEQSENLDLEKASEYLVIAATLMVLKSKALIPNSDDQEDATEDLPEYSRFFEDLRARLIAYENTRIRAQALIESPQLDVDTFVRRDRSVLNVPPEMIAEGEEPSRLGKLFLSLIKRVGGLARTYTISIETVSIVSYMMKLVDDLKLPINKGRQTLINLALGFASKDSKLDQTPRNIVLGSFVAVLELAKRGLIKVSQPDESQEISLELTMKEFDGNDFQSEFDENKASQNQNNEEPQVPYLEVVNGRRN